MSEMAVMKRILEQTGLYDIREGTVIYAEMMAYAAGLDPYFEELERLLGECFVDTAQGIGLTLREAWLGTMNLDQTLTGRRNALRRALSINSREVTSAQLQNVLQLFNVHGTLTYDQTNHKTVLTCTDPLTSAQKQRLQSQLGQLMPCWASFEVVLT